MGANIKLAIAAAFVAAAYVPAYAVTDTVQAPTGFFTPSLGQEKDFPFYRRGDEDWGWQHGAITGPVTSAKLSISAYDVDFNGLGTFNGGERDAIYIGTSTSGIFLGYLEGEDDVFSFKEFDLTPYLLLNPSLLAGGLQIFMDIDSTNNNWLVSLGKSVITTDGEDPGNPNPGQVPIPGALPLFASGLGALGLLQWRRRRNKAA